MSSKPATGQHLDDLVWLHRVRDRIDREYAQPLDVEALARGAHMSAGHFSRQFRLAYGERDGGDAVVCRETGDPTDQESRSPAHRASVE
ncbi:hypothetical protein BH23ACT11_BH23ACT11_26000 [soil metagenome]